MQKGLVLILALVGIGVFVACAAGMTETEVREIARDEMVLVPAPTGIPGPQGPPGEKGLPGVTGPIGITGIAGPMGAAGPQGESGIEGLQGDIGPQGPRGDKGDTGAVGPQGPAGPAGASPSVTARPGPTPTPKPAATPIPTATSTPMPTSTAIPATSVLGERNNPVPIGVTSERLFEDNDWWEVTVLGTEPDATAMILAENRYNDPPQEDNQFFMVRVRAKYLGTGSVSFDGGFRLKALGDGGVVYSTFDNSCGVIPDELPDPELFTNGTIEGNECWQVATDDVDSLLMILEADLLSFSDERAWFALQ